MFSLIFYHFSKSGKGWVGGIENFYHDPCQDWLDLVNMKLTSPNYPVRDSFDKYATAEDCTWKITAPSGHFVTVDFEIIYVNNKELPLLPVGSQRGLSQRGLDKGA